MKQYIPGEMIKRLREQKGMTQLMLAEKLMVSDKTVSKWETSKGLPDISLVQPLASALGISVIELMSGIETKNTNPASDMQRLSFYVCPICGNVICSVGEATVSCHGITLPPLTAEPTDELHDADITVAEDEYYVEISHEMSKTHYISFIAAVADDGVEIKKLYQEGDPSSRFKISRARSICFYCNKDGLFVKKVK